MLYVAPEFAKCAHYIGVLADGWQPCVAIEVNTPTFLYQCVSFCRLADCNVRSVNKPINKVITVHKSCLSCQTG